MSNYKTTYRPESKLERLSIKGKKHIAIIGGGMSAEREVSLVSSKAVIDATLRLGYQVTFIDMGGDIGTVLGVLKPDIVYNCLHGTYGEDGCLQGLLNIMRIPYTHSGLAACAIGFCKEKSKIFFESKNIKTAPYIIINKSENIKKISIEWDSYVIKPLEQGSSIGIEVIFPEDNYDFSKYEYPYGDKIMIEKYILGREMQVALLNGKALGVLELQLLKNRFYDYESKYLDGFTKHIYPAQISSNIEKKILIAAEKAYNVLGCRGLARAEFIYDEKEQDVYIIEVNTHSGMTPLSICPEIAAGCGIDFDRLVEEIIEAAQFDV